MMTTTLSEALEEAYASNPSDVVILDTLELIHPDFKDEDGKQTAVLPWHAHRVCLFRNGDGWRQAGFRQTGGRLCRLQDLPLEKGRRGN